MRILRALFTKTPLYPDPHGSKLPVITLPVAIENRVRRIVRKQKVDAEIDRIKTLREGERNSPVITCKRKNYNYYYNQSYSKFEVLPLASKGWLSRRSVDDFFTIHYHGGIPSWRQVAKNRDDQGNGPNFENLGIQTDLINNLKNMEILTPTNIQSIAIPEMLEDTNVLCSAETGNGKTLAYLLPLLSKMLNNTSYKNKPENSPSVLIIAPSRELVEQISDVSTKVMKNLPLEVGTVLGNMEPPKDSKMIDVMVGTVGALRSKVDAGIYNMNWVKHVVLDEVDTLLDNSFNEELRNFLLKFVFHDDLQEMSGMQRGLVQMIMVGATLPKNANESLEGVVALNSMVKVKTNALHKVLPHVPQTFLRLRISDRKIKLIELVKKDVSKKKYVLVFTKKSSTCDWLRMELQDNGVNCVNFHANMPANLRKKYYKCFTEGDCKVMVATDLASRGLDFTNVHHVINYDMPDVISDYIHRVGRVGRVGSKYSGHVTNFVAASWEVTVTQAIETAVRKMSVLPNVDANIKRKLEHRAEMKEYKMKKNPKEELKSD